jgi:cell wall-associated NlpC family hydrolase/membrane-bound lytic murein transglycosylase B
LVTGGASGAGGDAAGAKSSKKPGEVVAKSKAPTPGAAGSASGAAGVAGLNNKTSVVQGARTMARSLRGAKAAGMTRRQAFRQGSDQVGVDLAARFVQAETGIPPTLSKPVLQLAAKARGFQRRTKILNGAGGAVFLAPLAVIAMVIVLVVIMITGAGFSAAWVATPSKLASDQISSAYLSMYQKIATQDEVPWTLLAAIGHMTTDDGRTSPYDTITRTTTYPNVSPPIVGTSTQGVGPMLISADVVNTLTRGQPQNAEASASAIAYAMEQAGRTLAQKQGVNYDTMASDPLTQSGTFWSQAVATLPIATASNCDPPNYSANTGGPATSSASTYADTTDALGADIEYIWSCELSARQIVLAAGPDGTVVPSASADNQLISEALDVSWSYSQYGTVKTNCNPFPIPSESTITPCSPGDPPSQMQGEQIEDIKAAAVAVTEKAAYAANAPPVSEWSVLPGVVVAPSTGQGAASGQSGSTGSTTSSTSTTTTTVPNAQGSNVTDWDPSAPDSSACVTDLYNALEPESSTNSAGLPEPGAFAASPSGAQPTAANEAAAWAASPLSTLSNNPDCEVPGINGAAPAPKTPTVWAETVTTAASEVLGQIEVSQGAAADVSNLEGLITYLDGVGQVPAASSPATTLVPRLAQPPVQVAATQFPVQPDPVGSSGFGAQVVNQAMAFDAATVNDVVATAGLGGSIPGVPPGWLQWAQQAGQFECPQYPLMPYVLLAISYHETRFQVGETNSTAVGDGEHATGPMQFIPSTFAEYAVSVNGDVPNINNPEDAFYAAANMLCHNSGGGQNMAAALAQYGFNGNPSPGTWTGPPCEAANDQPGGNDPSWVFACAASYQTEATQGLSLSTLPTGAMGEFVAAALSQVGKPYGWGAQQAGVAFDCSGLVDWSALQVVGPPQYLGLPAGDLGSNTSHGATSETLYDLTKANTVPTAQAVPGDLVFFAGSDGTMTAPGHIGIVVGNGEMVDAPFTGAFVRVEAYTGASDLVGITTP